MNTLHSVPVIDQEPAPRQAALGTGETPEHGREQPPADAEMLPVRPSYVFLASIAAVSLLLDVVTKAWAESALVKLPRSSPSLVLIEDRLSFMLAYNRGGAWGLLQEAGENLRRPFFLVVSLAAVIFIVSLYGRLVARQWALKWGLPLVLGGALGNLADRVVRGSVVDFIDYRADWVASMNRLVAKVSSGWHVTDHWPTFNVADISICVGVGLMAIDMLTAKHAAVDDRSKVDSGAKSDDSSEVGAARAGAGADVGVSRAEGEERENQPAP